MAQTADNLRHHFEATREARAGKQLAELIEAVAVHIENHPSLWNWGDGEGGYVRHLLTRSFTDHGLIAAQVVAKEPGPRRPVSPGLRRRVHERDEYRCVVCGTYLDLQVDHILPVARGGTNDFDNLQTLCGPCNASKGTK